MSSPQDRHGHFRSPTWYSHKGMLYRCQDPGSNQYANYQARGITVCERWQTFANFLEDMGERPDGKTLDRIDNDKGYSKENCRWATLQEQGRNTRRSKLTLETATAAAVMRLRGEWGRIVAAKFGISRSTVNDIVNGRCWVDALEAAKKIIGESNDPQPE